MQMCGVRSRRCLELFFSTKGDLGTGRRLSIVHGTLRRQGDELAARVKVQTPSTPVMMLTGFAELMEAADQKPAGVDLVVAKPTTLARLHAAIATLIPDPDEAFGPTPASNHAPE